MLPKINIYPLSKSNIVLEITHVKMLTCVYLHSRVNNFYKNILFGNYHAQSLPIFTELYSWTVLTETDLPEIQC